MRYDPTDEWELRREIKLLATRLEAVGKEVYVIPMPQLLWSALEKVSQIDAGLWSTGPLPLRGPAAG